MTHPTQSPRRLRGTRWFTEVGWRHLVGIVMIIFCVLPLLYVVSTSLQPNATLTGSNRLFSSVSLTNFAALNETHFWRWALNSLLVTSATAIGSVLMAAAAAYAFSRFRFTGRRSTLTFLLVKLTNMQIIKDVRTLKKHLVTKVKSNDNDDK